MKGVEGGGGGGGEVVGVGGSFDSSGGLIHCALNTDVRYNFCVRLCAIVRVNVCVRECLKMNDIIHLLCGR